MDASLAATGMLEVLATRAVLFIMDSFTPPISTFSYKGERRNNVTVIDFWNYNFIIN